MKKDFILQIEGLKKDYVSQSETLSVLRGLCLCVERGKCVSIIGESGNGKSTLLNILGGIDSACGGKVFVAGRDILALDEEALTEYRSRFVGLVFQFHYLLKDFTAEENVFLPAFMAGEAKSSAEKKALRLINDVGLSERKDHLPSELSGGERQRVAVARSLVNDPELVLADEPTGNLDPANAQMIGDLLFSVCRRYKKTLLLVTHDMNLAKKADEIYRLKDGVLEGL